MAASMMLGVGQYRPLSHCIRSILSPSTKHKTSSITFLSNSMLLLIRCPIRGIEYSKYIDPWKEAIVLWRILISSCQASRCDCSSENSLLIANLPIISSDVDLQKLAIESE